MKRNKFVVMVVLLFVLSACTPTRQPEPQNAPAEPQETAPPGSKGVETPVEGTDGQGSLVLVLDKSGGFAGKIEKWSVYADGTILNVLGETMKVDPEKVSELLAEIQAAGFFEMKSESSMFNSCRDCFNYSLTVNNDGRPHTVTAVEGVDGAPAAYWQIVADINALLAEAK